MRPLHFLDGYPLDTDDWWVLDRSQGISLTTLPEVLAAAITLPSRDGEITGPGYRRAAVWPLSMMVRGVTHEDLMRNLATVLRLVEATVRSPHVLERRLSGASRQGMVQRRRSVEPVMISADIDQRCRIELEFQVPAGRLYDTATATDTAGSGESVLVHLSGGGVETDDVRIRFPASGPTTDVTVTDVDSGSWLRVAGNIPAGAIVTVDPRAYTATLHSGADVSGLLDFGPSPFCLSPSARVRVTQNTAQPITFTGRRAFSV